MERNRKRIFPFIHKLMISYILLVLTPVAIIGYFSYTSSMKTLKENAHANMVSALQQTRESVMTEVGDIEKVSDQLYLDQSLQRVILTSYGAQRSYEMTTEYLLPKLESAVQLTRTPIMLSFYYANSTLPEIYYDQSIGDPLQKGHSFEMYHMDRLDHQSWYPSLKLDSTNSLWEQIDNDRTYGNISFSRKLVDFKEMAPIGFIRITTKISQLFHALDYRKIGENSFLLVVDGSNRVVYQSARGQGPPPDWTKDLTDYLVLRDPLPKLGWDLVALVPLSELNRNAKHVRTLIVIVCLASFSILSIVAFFLSRYFSRVMTKIVTSLHAFQSGEFHKRIHYSGNDEFVLIADAFNEMAQNIEKLIQEVYVSNLRKQEAELTALQAQINPHFLYNTLSSISRLAKLGEIDKLHEMVLGLAKFYRLSLNDGSTLISIDKELQQIQAYVAIQQIKYGERLEVSYTIDPEVLRFDKVKLILQPFVENALEHAWFGDTIHICIVAANEEEAVRFSIIDNGVGMRQATIEQIFDRSGVRLGYGIRNVDDRIKLQFGESYGVQLYSKPGIGTTVSIAIPFFKVKT